MTTWHKLVRWIVQRCWSFVYAGAGVLVVARQPNMQIHLVATVVVVAAGLGWRVSLGEWLALVIAITLVLVLEAVNTALEAVVDLASPGVHPLAKRAKDVAAGAVLLAACGAVVVAALVFGPRLWRMVGW